MIDLTMLEKSINQTCLLWNIFIIKYIFNYGSLLVDNSYFEKLKFKDIKINFFLFSLILFFFLVFLMINMMFLNNKFVVILFFNTYNFLRNLSIIQIRVSFLEENIFYQTTYQFFGLSFFYFLLMH